MLNKNPNSAQPPPAVDANGQSDAAALYELLSARDAACAVLTSQHVKFADVLEQQAKEIAKLKQELAAAETSVEARYAETAKLSSMVLQLQEAVSAKENALRAEEDAKQQLIRQHAGELSFIESAKQDLIRAHLTERTALSRKYERERALAEHHLAVSNVRCHALQGLIEIHRGRADAYRASSDQMKSSSAWKLSSIFHRQPDPILPALPADDAELETALIQESDLFDLDWYIAQYPEAAESGVDPIRHYLTFGAIAGFSPGPRFDTIAYLVRYPDVRRSGMNPLVHFIKYGQGESRDPSPDADASVRAINADA
jgi:hypothetical protein